MTIETRGATAFLQWHRWQELELHYDNTYPNAPYLSRANNDDNKFSFELDGWVYFYIDMHRMSGDTRWITLAVNTCQHFIDNNDEARVARGDFILTGSTVGVDRYWQAPYPYTTNGTPVPGWSSNNASAGLPLRVQILIDGQIIGAMASLAGYILDQNITASITDANTFFAHIKRVLDSHNNSWRDDRVSTSPPMTVQGSWYYPERVSGLDQVFSAILAFNHLAGACNAAILYHKHFTDAGLLDKATRFMAFTRSNRVDTGDMYQWAYTVETAGSEDLNHGSYSFTFFMSAKINSLLSFTEEELTKYANATVNAWVGTKVGDLAEKFDGTGVMPVGEIFDPASFVDLAKYNTTLLKIVTEAHAVNSKSQSNYGKMMRGAAAILRYNQIGSLL